MIDDLTVAGRVEGIEDLPEGLLPLDPVRGRPDVFGISRREGRLYVTYCPATKIVTVRLSVPRLASSPPQRTNFPLVPLDSVEDLHPDSIALEVSNVLHLGLLFHHEVRERLPIRDWAVIRASHAVDVRVRDPLRCIMGALGFRRRHEGKRACFGTPISTVQWASRSLRMKLYAKGLELDSHRRRTDEEARQLERLAEDAAEVVRFEVSFLQVRGLRGLFGWDGSLPTLSLMCDPLIDKWVLTREVDRLRLLDETAGDDQRVFFPARVRQVGARLLEAQRCLAEGGGTLGRRKTLTPDRLWDLSCAFFLLSGYRPDEVAAISGWSPSALAEMQAELRELGIAPDASFSGTASVAAGEILAGLRPHLLDEWPPSLTHWEARLGRVEAPWADDGEDDVDEAFEVLDGEADPSASVVEEVGIGGA